MPSVLKAQISVNQDNPQPGKRGSPKQTLVLLFVCVTIFVGSLLYQLVSEVRDTASLFFSAAVNYDKHDKVMT